MIMKRKNAFILWLICLFACVTICFMQLFQALFGSVKRSVNMAIGIDQTVNALLGGLPDETISARVHRSRWKRCERLINWLFNDPAHCQKAYESEVMLSHFPYDYRSPS